MKPIKLSASKKNYTAHSGIYVLKEVMEKLKVKDIFRKDLPSVGWIDSWSKFECLVTSFFMGGDCLEDLDSFKNDDLFLKVHEEVIASTTAGKFLRSFNDRQVEKLEDNLIKLAMKARMSIHKEDKDFIFCNDGTFHEQEGEKMEGLGFDYNNNWGLSSLQGYDQYDFCYGFNLRGGSTHSSVGAESMIYRVFKQVPEGMNRYFLGDSAYGSLSIFNQLIASQVKFVIPLKE
ncbi:MAG: transposase, partial [Bacteriovoracaceae bacterium]|nr:transposase [Bacteriovoracaceae bacterium]